MRIRITDTELPYYMQAKRDNTIVRRDRQNWYVVGITADSMSGATANLGTRYKSQWWVELSEAR
jgi:hypothetical protein